MILAGGGVYRGLQPGTWHVRHDDIGVVEALEGEPRMVSHVLKPGVCRLLARKHIHIDTDGFDRRRMWSSQHARDQ
jgi:hypothetical protein